MADQRDRWSRIDALFHDALDRPASDRGAYLRERAAGDEQLVRDVEALVTADSSSHVLLDAPAPAQLPVGMRLGPYAVERILGSGGMATVYLARRADHQFDKHVAIKLVHQGLGAALAGGRFDTERNVLARLEHANIARLLDAGLNEFGQPYLVMEWVDGVTLDLWVRETQPSVDQKLDLWLDLAGAVAYAHRNLIVHRDIKPSNVLVGRDGTAKLVDFGIAKLIDEGIEALQTRTVHLTPRYASPEQLRGEPATTATDVFGLGLLLCELVTGLHPFDRAGMMRHGQGAVAPLPEPVVASSAPADLAAIIRMAVRQEPERRYATATALAEDVRRYRRGLPVLAQPETVAYRLRKFVARHRTGAAAAALMLAMVIGAVALIVNQTAITAAERDRANLEARKTDQINVFLQNMLRAADPTREGRDVRVVEVLDQAAERLKTELQGQPEIEADLRTTLASSYQSLGVFDGAVNHARRALELRRELFGPRHAEVARTQLGLGDALFERGDYPEAETMLREALAMLEGLGLASSMETADGHRYLGEVLNETGQHEEAERSYRTAIALYRRLIPQDDEHVARALNDLAVSLGTRSQLAEAEPLHREALAIMRRVHGPEHLEVAQTIHNVAGVLDTQGRFDEAESLYREALAIELTLLGEDHSKVVLTRTSLANLFWMKNDYGPAEAFARAALTGAARGLPDGHPLMAYAHLVLGQTLTDARRPAEGEPHLRAALEMRRKLLPADHWLIANTESVLGGAIAAQGRYSEAESHLLAGYGRLEADRGKDADKTRDARRRLAALYRAWGKNSEAERYSIEP
jgi:serine/threonine-protein kinase